ncbi:hypothetical protein [Streptomyces albicerus]|uniref:hypothetical protein n=1 Tax=Streptomyces albicerus TaxID=2569859 RepID=UPI001CECFD53|nr:hypothetical protein [Streptomyces albicerus]
MTVNIDGVHRGAAELLVDGKETGRAEAHGSRPLILVGELPTDPPLAVSVRITPGPGAPRCTAVIDGVETVMSPRAF